jgi:hypothetical protein
MTTKKAIVLLSMILVLAFSSTVFAAKMTFTKFSVEVPNGWSASEDGSVVALIAPKNVAALSIAVDNAEGASAKDLAGAMSAQLKGTKPKKDGDGYEFTFKNQNGVSSKSILYVSGKEFIMFTITGEHPDIVKILESVKDR